VNGVDCVGWRERVSPCGIALGMARDEGWLAAPKTHALHPAGSAIASVRLAGGSRRGSLPGWLVC